MKPFLGIDLTTNKKNKQQIGDEFLIQQPSLALSESLDSSFEHADETIEKSKIPLPFRIVQYVSGFAALLIVSGIMRADVSFAEGYQNAPGLFWAAPICAVIWLLLWLWSRQKSKTVLGEDESTLAFSNLDNSAAAVFEDLSVPDSAKDVDILSFFYKLKDGNIKVVTKGTQTAQCFNPAFEIFSDTENLYLANLEGKYAFPLNSITTIHTIKKRISIIGWNKEEPFNKGVYKPYKLTANNYGSVFCKCYHILEINYQGETYGIYFPSYELPVFEEVTGLKA